MNIKSKLKAVFYFISFAFLIPFVSAFDASSVSNAITNGIEVFKAFYSPFFEAIIGTPITSEFFLAKVLILVLLFVVIRAIATTIPAFKDNKTVIFIIALVISVFAVRFISENQLINGILLPYGTLGITLITIIPFLVFFYFIHKSIESSAGRRLCWALYIAILTILLFNQKDSISSVGGWIYVAVIAIIVLAFLFDRQIRVYFSMHEIKRMERAIKDRAVLDLLDQLEKAYKWENSEYGKRRIKEIKEKLKDLGVKRA
ncbi:MAG: hypothetical protein AABX07_06165 [Nanoarchaeota archaeon]